MPKDAGNKPSPFNQRVDVAVLNLASNLQYLAQLESKSRMTGANAPHVSYLVAQGAGSIKDRDGKQACNSLIVKKQTNCLVRASTPINNAVARLYACMPAAFYSEGCRHHPTERPTDSD